MSANSYTNETDWLDGDWVADEGHHYGITGRVKYDRDGLRYLTKRCEFRYPDTSQCEFGALKHFCGIHEGRS